MTMMVYKSPRLSTLAIVVLLLHHFVTSSARLQSGDGTSFDDEMMQIYIFPSPLEQCPERMFPCCTLNQFASNKTYRLSENTSITLILQPGTHHLDSELTVANVSQFSIIGVGMQNVTIECSEKFIFENVMQVNISDLQFVGCTHHIKSVEQSILDNCIFDGLGRTGTALNIKETKSVNVTNCTFFDTQGSYDYYYPNGGAIIFSTNSRISLQYSTFERICAKYNRATYIFAEQGSELRIQRCTYRHNSIRYGFFIYGNSSSIIVNETRFENNTVSTVIQSEGSYTFSTLTNIRHSNFSNNFATFGILSVVLSVLHIEDCKFSDNRAIHVLYAAGVSSTISNVRVWNNSAPADNYIADAISMLLVSCNTSCLGNTEFINNEGSIIVSGGTVMLDGNMTMINNEPNLTTGARLLSFAREGGAIFVFQCSVQVRGKLTLMNNSADNGGAMYLLNSIFSVKGEITIANNRANKTGGGIYMYQSQLNIQGECLISNNKAVNGSGIYAVSSFVTLENTLTNLTTTEVAQLSISSNRAEFGGAIFLSGNSKIIINTYIIAPRLDERQYQIQFIENTADYGGALYIDDATNSELCDSTSPLSMDRDCFIQIYSLFGSTGRIVGFQRNNATSMGANIFGGLLDRCTIGSNLVADNSQIVHGFDFIKTISNINDSDKDSISSHPVRLCFCMDDQPDCSYDPPPINVTKGQNFSIYIVAVDQVNHTLESNVEAFLNLNGGLLGEGQKQQRVNTTCNENNLVTYNIITPHETEQLLLNAVGPCGNAHASQRRVQVIFTDCTCPIGFQPVANVNTSCECECHSNLTNVVSTENCYPSNGTFKPNTNAWINYTNTTTEPNDYYLLVHSRCPYDYCKTEQVTISLSQPNGSNELCDFNRADTLCGACLPGYSVSFGSSRCMKCYGKYWPLVLVGIILLEVIAGIAIVCVLLFLNMTVAIGTLNGILFYANIVYGNASIFFNNLSTPFPSVFIAWLNLDIGFNVCLYDGIDTFAKTLLQLVFPIYLIILVVAVIIISKYSQRFSNLIGKKDPVATLATLILLSYAKILSTVITMLSLTTLEYPEGKRTLWKPDATIEYLKHPKHIVLFFVAIIILLLSGTYTIILTSWQLLVRLPNWRVFAWVHNPKLSSFIGAYHAPYTPKHRYWTGLLLTLRVILFLVSAINSTESTQEPLVAITVAVGCLVFLDTKNVYRKTYLNIIEILSLANILAFTAFTWYATDTSDTKLQNAIAHISVSITCILLIFVILFHVFKYTKFNAIIKKTKFPAKLQSIKSHVKKKPPQRHYNVDLELANETRDVNIFELVNTNDNTCRQPQVQPSAQPHGVSHSTIEIPKPKED